MKTRLDCTLAHAVAMLATALALESGAATLPENAVPAADDELRRLVAEDVAKPVRPAGVDGQPFWNGNALWFMYPPSFDFAETPGAGRCRFRVFDANGREHAFEAASPKASLEGIWAELPTGQVDVWCEAYSVSSWAGHTHSRQFRTFWKSAPYRPGAYPAAPRTYADAVRLGFDYVFGLPWLQHLERTGTNDLTCPMNAYPSKMNAAIAQGMVRCAAADPLRRSRALGLARKAVDYLIARAQPAGAPLAHFPPTYEGDKWTARGNAGLSMLIYPATAALAYVRVYEATKDERYLKEAEAVAATYLKLQGADGTWPLKVGEKDGRPVAANRLFPSSVIEMFDALERVTGKAEYRAASDRAFAYVESGPLRDWSWEGQFEDVEMSRRYVNLTKHSACWTAMRLVARWPHDEARLAQARELLRFAEDQFVCWERPWRDQRRSFQQETFVEWKVEPAVVEQYFYKEAIDASAAKLIRTYLALHRATGNPLDLAKARTLGDSCVRMQEKSGRIPTVWSQAGCNAPETDWINCMLATYAALDELAKAESQKEH